MVEYFAKECAVFFLISNYAKKMTKFQKRKRKNQKDVDIFGFLW